MLLEVKQLSSRKPLMMAVISPQTYSGDGTTILLHDLNTVYYHNVVHIYANVLIFP